MNHNQPQFNMSDMRARLKQSREVPSSAPTQQNTSVSAYDFRTSTSPQYPFPGDTVSISTKLSETAGRAKGPLMHLHLYWHIYISGGLLILFHTLAFAPQWFPGTHGMSPIYQKGMPFLVPFALCIPAIGAFFVLRKMRRSFQQAAKITEAKNWSSSEWIGAAVGFALMSYLTFFHQGGIEGMLQEHMLPEFIKGPFDLTAREWIFACVKCLGGAVFGAMMARKFLAGENLFGRR